MRVPQVAIVGRPNVGKSSLFNWIVGIKLAIVDDRPGVTRDRMTHVVAIGDRHVELTDTGGMGIEDSDDLTRDVEEQIVLALDLADVILFVVDVQTGLTTLDELAASRLRATDKPVILVCNKTDDRVHEPLAHEFLRLGFPDFVHASVTHNRGRAELLDEVLRVLPEASGDETPVEPEMRVAIVGRRNVGKSTFVNSLAQAKRMIVSEIPGTTRDSVNVRFEMDGKAFVAIDTPGLKKAKSVRSDIEYYSSHRARRSVRHADVVLMFFDASERIGKVDKQLCNYIADQFKPTIFVVNKWDLVADKMPTERWANYLRETFPSLDYAPIAFITGQTGRNVKTLLNHAQMLFKQARSRVGTGELNRLVQAAIAYNAPPTHAGKTPKVYYATQIGVQPPTIVLVCNEPNAFPPAWQRYLAGRLRDELPFAETPLKLYFSKRTRDGKPGAAPDEADDVEAGSADGAE